MKRILLAALLLLLSPPAARAFTNDGTELEPLSFGQLIITDNSAPRACTIPAGGTQSCDPQIMILQPGRYGIFRLSGFDPAVALFAVIDDTATELSGPSGFGLDVRDFTFDPDLHDFGTAQPPGADGTLELRIGATLRTRAGPAYPVAPYRGTFTLLINY